MPQAIRFQMKMPVKIKRKKEWIVASCPILDIFSQGETEGKAKKNLAEALSLFFISCFERGTLDEVLKNCGFKAVSGLVLKKSTWAKTQNFINVPIPFQIDPRRASECHV